MTQLALLSGRTLNTFTSTVEGGERLVITIFSTIHKHRLFTYSGSMQKWDGACQYTLYS